MQASHCLQPAWLSQLVFAWPVSSPDRVVLCLQVSICLQTVLAQAPAPGPGHYHVASPVAAPPAQQYTYSSPPGVVGGLFKNLSVPPTAYVSFQAVAQDTSLEAFDKATQTYYINSIASYLNGSASQVAILKIDGSPRQVASGPTQANQSVIHQGPAAGPNMPPLSSLGRFPAAGPMYRSMAPAPAIRGRSLLQVHTGENAALAAPAGPVLYIYTAVTLDTSGVGKFIERLFVNTTSVLDPEVRAGAGAVSVQDVIWGKDFTLLMFSCNMSWHNTARHYSVCMHTRAGHI